MKRRIRNAKINAQSRPRKWCVEQSMRLEKWLHCLICINCCHIPDPHSHRTEARTIDIEKINEDTSDKEEEREMEIDGFQACSPDNVRPWIAIGKEHTHSRSLAQYTRMPLSDRDVLNCPIPILRCQQGTRETDSQAQEPK